MNSSARYNSDLANILGNLVNRTLAMTGKYFGGIVPVCGEPSEFDLDLRRTANQAVESVEAAMNGLRVADALGEIWTLLRRSNRYIDETEPWLLAKDEAKRERLGTVLYHLLEAIRVAAVLLKAFLPETAERIFRQLNTEETAYESILRFGGLRSGDPLGASEVLFARLDEKALMERIAKEQEESEPSKITYTPLAGEITIDQFGAIDLRAARVLTCEPVKKSAKLLQLTVDLGFEKRQVVSGIAKWYEPADLVGKTVVLVANLKPARLCGIESQGMILACDGADDSAQVVFLPDGTEPGSVIR